MMFTNEKILIGSDHDGRKTSWSAYEFEMSTNYFMVFFGVTLRSGHETVIVKKMAIRSKQFNHSSST